MSCETCKHFTSYIDLVKAYWESDKQGVCMKDKKEVDITFSCDKFQDKEIITEILKNTLGIIGECIVIFGIPFLKIALYCLAVYGLIESLKTLGVEFNL